MSISLFDVIRLRNFDTLRAWLQVAVPVVLVALVHSNVDLWVGLALAIFAPAFAAINSVNGFRTWFYGVLAAAQAVLLGLDVVTQAQIIPWIAVIGAVIGGGVAAKNVSSTPAFVPEVKG